MNKRNEKITQWFLHVRELLESGATVEFVPVGSSMQPTLHPDSDVVKIVKSDCYRRGDIVLAYSDTPEGVFLHRIVAIKGSLYILMGDANLYQQEMCSRSQIIGRVISINRNDRDVTASATNRLLRRIFLLPIPLRRIFARVIGHLNH